MNELSNRVYIYYCEHFAELTGSKQLHFSSRLKLWSDDPYGEHRLEQMRSQITLGENPAAALRSVYDEAQQTIYHGSKNAAELREQYFVKYPQLRSVALVLFRLTFMKTIYGLDAKETLFELFPKAELDDLMQQLLADHDALAILSTHAVNVLYLYSRMVLEDDSLFDPAMFLEIGAKRYDLDNLLHLQLYIYLYTHCVIGESNFYSRKIAQKHMPVYQKMMDELEAQLEKNLDNVNLDNKFEFLVCCKLVGKKSKLEAKIFEEAGQSVSPDGTFLIDTHNKNPQTANSTLDLSEHRNVLFIMANREPSALS